MSFVCRVRACVRVCVCVRTCEGVWCVCFLECYCFFFRIVAPFVSIYQPLPNHLFVFWPFFFSPRACLPFGAFVCLLSGMYLLFTSPAGVFSLIWPIGGKQTFPLPPLAALPPLAPPPSLTPPPPIAPPPPTTRMGTASWLWVGVKRTTEVNKPASGDRKE